MKIVCDACQAKYSISDDKVQGKVFKIRCKKCSNIIVVRGGAQAAEAQPAAQEKDTRVYDYGYDGGGQGAPADDAVWHLVINQDQVGPMTASEVQQRFAAGEVDGETFAWREGFADWLPLAQVDAFAALVASGSTTTAAPSGGGAAAVASMFGGGDELGTVRSDAGDLFAAASGGAAARDDDGGDLFGSKPNKASGGASAGQQKLRGERNENSVLFSLNNLAQLASDKPAPVAAAAPGHATGAAGGEGSGLIDIRSMASAYLGGSGAAGGGAKPATSSAIGSIDDLPVFGGGGFSEPAVIVPTARASGNNKVLYIMIGAVGLLAIAAVIMVVMLLKSKTTVVAAADKGAASVAGGDDKGDKGDKPADTKTDPAAGSAQGATPTADKPAETGSGGSATQVATADKPAETPKPEEHAAETHSAPAPAHHESHHESTTHVAAATHTASHEAAPKPPPADTSAGGGGCDEVSCVLNNYEGACCAKFKKGGHGGGGAAHPSGGGGGDLPEELDRGMISSAIASVKGRAMACGDRSSAKGVVKVHVKVGGDGRISSVSVSQSPDPALGSCVQAAVSRATFPRTQRGGSFSYPFPF